MLPDDHPIAAQHLSATGEVHDGDTFRLNTGQNARLFGADAFELNQTGRARDGSTVPLGMRARSALAPYAQPDATVTPTGEMTYGRPVASLDRNGDAAAAIIGDGLGIAIPQYLRADPARLAQYMEAERGARLNRRGAWQTQFEQPSSFRHHTPDPWAKPEAGTAGNSTAVFWDEALPAQGLRPEIAKGYASIFQDMKSTPDDLLRYAKANGFAIDPGETRKLYAARAKAGGAGDEVTYRDPPRVLTDLHDGKLGAGLRGVADPFNVLDETGALVDTLGGTKGRESLWNSDRRFGDVYANNLDQNRSILAADDANHPYVRFAGQMAGGLAVPGASIEGLGFQAARDVLTAGGTRMAAEQAARSAVVRRLGTVGAAEGAAAGAGAGEDMRGRVEGALIGAPVGLTLGGGTGVAAPVIAKAIGKPFSRLAGRNGERTANDFTDGTLDAAKAASEDALPVGPPGNIASRPVGKFGPIHDDVAGDYHAAFGRMAADDAGEVPGAVQHPELGPIDLIWGDHSYGLSKIVAKHPEVVDDLPAIIEKLPVAQHPHEVGNNRFVLEDDTHRAVVAPDFDGEAKRWVVTAFEKKAPEGADISPRSPVSDGGSTDAGTATDIGRAASLRNMDMAAEYDTPTLVSRDMSARPRPLMDPATDAERLAAAQRLNPRDVLPIPANTVDGVEEAARIDAGRFDPVKAPDEHGELSTHRMPNANTGTLLNKRGPADLVTWLRSEGGIKPQGAELEHYGIDNRPRRGIDFAEGENRFGPLVNDNGMTYDEAAHRAWERGYFPDHADRPTEGDFIEALDATHTGRQRSFLPEDWPEIDAFQSARRQRGYVESAKDDGAPLVDDNSQPIKMADLEANAPPVHAYEEWGENAPNLAGNIRLDKLDSPQSIKRALAVTDRVSGGFDAARRGRITQAETQNLADDLGMTVDVLLKRRNGEAFNAEQALAARQLLARSGTDLVNMAKKLSSKENPGDELEASFREAWVRHAAIQEQVSGMTAEAGRALSQFRMTAESRAIADRVLPSLGDVGGGSGRLRDVANRIVDLEKVGTSPSGVNQFALRALSPRFKDKVSELYINSLLSGPQTHVVNILSNTITALSQIPEQAVTAGVGLARQGVARAFRQSADPERVMFTEVGSRAVGLIQGTREGMRDGIRALVTGNAVDPVTKLETQSMSAIGGKVGSFIRTPTRFLTAEDELFKGIARRMELTGLAMRKARLEGLRGPEARQRAGELVANPTDEMIKRSFDFARSTNPLRGSGVGGELRSGTQGPRLD